MKGEGRMKGRRKTTGVEEEGRMKVRTETTGVGKLHRQRNVEASNTRTFETTKCSIAQPQQNLEASLKTSVGRLYICMVE